MLTIQCSFINLIVKLTCPQWSLYIDSYILFKNKLFISVSLLLQLIRCAQKIVSRCSEVYSSDWFVRSQSRGCGRKVACHRSSVVWATHSRHQTNINSSSNNNNQQSNSITTILKLWRLMIFFSIILPTFTYIYIYACWFCYTYMHCNTNIHMD